MNPNDQGGWEYETAVTEKRNRRERLRRLSLILMLVSFALLVLIGYRNHTKAAQDPKFCLNCHEMQESYDAWQSASHSKTDCITCHKDISIAGVLYKQKLGVNRVKEIKVEVDDAVCSKCHADARVITPPMDLIIPHNLHVQKGLSCTQCHRAVTHGTVVKTVNVTAPGQAGPTLKGENLFDPNRIPMAGCMTCHNGAKATRSCNACHADKEPPATHTAKDFKANHGFSAVDNINACNKCHQYDTTLQIQYQPKNKGWEEVQSFARKTDFCVTCHQVRPQGHLKLFTVNHGPAAKENVNRCLTCHNYDDKGKVPEKAVTNVTCASCHYNQHPADFQKLHPRQLDKSNQAKCFTCHDATSCNDCHNKTFRSKK
ncbi:MAG TPA: NapC/NirT family cytochrome c [Verrucomicrobiae bacterium]|nr:NapC/NirT family cytochrome c [Verrucomicrobiae bacterium]